ncbi:MAG: SDR family oxidoreductase [Mucilaginibacter sp.]|uniref:SDR family oxidoreductase n=1 Tax=Mucilaginibacter sp. TaxID=1882438 RepID=UPI0031A468FF
MAHTIKKIALVTGGSRGLGKNMALNIAQKGIDVIITYNSKQHEALAVVDEIKKAGGHAAALQLTVGDMEALPVFMDQLKTTLANEFNTDKFDFLINNGGANFVIPSFAETTEEQFDALLNMHFKGVYFLTQKSLPLLNDNGGIINVSTGLTRFVNPGSGTYASIKSSIEVLTMYLAAELGKRGINVNVIAPGPVATDFSGGRLRDTPAIQEHIKAVTAIPRIAQPDDIGGVAAFLCSSEAKWITAQRIEVSGGIHL